METQLNLFYKKPNPLGKALLKERISHTRLLAANPAFTIKKWEAGDERLPVAYQIAHTIVGELLIAATAKGIIYLGFTGHSRATAITDLQKRFPGNITSKQASAWISLAIRRIDYPEKESALALHLKGTGFQLAVWEKLLLIPFGGLANYKQLGNGEPAARAIGAAVGANPVSYLIPCHRVVHADGNFSGFFWGNEIKARLLIHEQAQTLAA